MDQETAKKVAAQARSFCWQFTEGAISLSEFLFAATALEAANRDPDLVLDEIKYEARRATDTKVKDTLMEIWRAV